MKQPFISKGEKTVRKSQEYICILDLYSLEHEKNLTNLSYNKSIFE